MDQPQNEQDDQFSAYDQRVVDAIALLNIVYGQINNTSFPWPLESYEAGPTNTSDQRRYLWTDAVGVMAYQTLVEYFTDLNDLESASLYQSGVERLIYAVHETLGRPRSHRKSDGMKECGVSPTGYVGLRIGKPTAKRVTDPFTRYDGMFWNHINMWLFALARTNHIDEAVRIAKSCFSSFFCETVYTGNYVLYKGGMIHKLSVDGSPAPTDNYLDYYDDTLNAFVVFNILEAKNQNTSDNGLSLQTEIGKLRQVLQLFNTTDPFAHPGEKPHLRADNHGWPGWEYWYCMEAIFDQFIDQPYRVNHYHFREIPRVYILDAKRVYHSRPWLAYSTLLGASVNGTLLSEEDIDDLLTMWVYRQPVQYQFLGGHPQEDDRKSGLARVLLAMALLGPGVLQRRVDDVLVQI